MALRTFVREVYAPGLHLAYSAAWFLALLGTLGSVEGRGTKLRVDASVVASIATVFLVLFFLRVVDEWKDLEYDRVHNPERPLVRGAVSKRDLLAYLAVTAVVVVALNAWLSIKLALIASLDMAWGIALVGLERVSRRVRDGMLLNLVVTYPVNVALSVYTYAFFLDRTHAAPSARGVLVLVAFALAFLVYELLRKTIWPAFAKPDERLYSRELGGAGAILLALACATLATTILVVLLAASGERALLVLCVAPMLPAILATVRFLRTRTRRVKLTPLGTAYLLVFYVGQCVAALAMSPFAGLGSGR